MSDAIPTVTIETENGPVRINASDFDPAKHKVHADNKNVPPAQAMQQPLAAPAQEMHAAPASMGVINSDSRFYVINGATGQKITDVVGIDPKGYVANTDAWNALVTVTPKPAT